MPSRDRLRSTPRTAVAPSGIISPTLSHMMTPRIICSTRFPVFARTGPRCHRDQWSLPSERQGALAFSTRDLREPSRGVVTAPAEWALIWRVHSILVMRRLHNIVQFQLRNITQPVQKFFRQFLREGLAPLPFTLRGGKVLLIYRSPFRAVLKTAELGILRESILRAVATRIRQAAILKGTRQNVDLVRETTQAHSSSTFRTRRLMWRSIPQGGTPAAILAVKSKGARDGLIVTRQARPIRLI
jgi:hypothetical protein